jgi:hypothetical protein
MKAALLRHPGWCQKLVLLSGQDYQKLLQWRLACHDEVDHCLDEQLYRDEGTGVGVTLTARSGHAQTTGAFEVVS